MRTRWDRVTAWYKLGEKEVRNGGKGLELQEKGWRPGKDGVGADIQNINGRLIPTAEVTSLIEQTTKARITEIYLFFFKKTNFFARYFGLQYKPSSGAERKRKVRNIKGSLQRRFKI